MCTSQGVTELLWNFANFFLGNELCLLLMYAYTYSCHPMQAQTYSSTVHTGVLCILSLSHTHTHTHTHYLGSLDPDGDPLCALLMIDYHALRAGEYDFLINLFSQWEVSSQHYMLLIDLAYPKLLTNSHKYNWLYRILCSHFLACFC